MTSEEIAEAAHEAVSEALPWWCGCGSNPEGLLLALLCELRDWSAFPAPVGHDAFRDAYHQHRDRLWALVRENPDQVLDIVYYALTGSDVLEHGGSVPGWLTEKGQKLIVDLKALRKAQAP